MIMKYCHDCKSHLGRFEVIEGKLHSTGYTKPMCTHPELRNSKTGQFQSCEKMRSGMCGAEGEYYEKGKLDPAVRRAHVIDLTD